LVNTGNNIDRAIEFQKHIVSCCLHFNWLDYLPLETCHLPQACEKSQLANLLIKIIEFWSRSEIALTAANQVAANFADELATCPEKNLPRVSELQLQLQLLSVNC